MAPIRRLSTQRLIALIAGLAVVLAAGGAIAVAATGGAKPPPKKLDAAIQDALSAPKVAGITARIRFTNHLVDSAGVGGGGPLVSGASGRLWASADGRARLELQSDRGGVDSQVVLDGRRVSVYESSSDTVYRATLPSHRGERGRRAETGPPALAEIDRVLGRIANRADLSGAEPGNVAGKPSYSVKATPRDHSGLVGAARLAWDAATGVPLGAAVYAAHPSAPVLELKATQVSYGSVAGAALSFAVPKGAKVVDLTSRAAGRQAAARHGKERRAVRGLGAVRQAVGFPVAAPARLAGKDRTQVRLIRAGDHPAALVTYGTGLGGIAVIESPAKPQEAHRSRPKEGQVTLPRISVKGASGQELRTALGTVVRFDRAGVSYVVLGSVPPAVAETAARGL